MLFTIKLQHNVTLIITKSAFTPRRVQVIRPNYNPSEHSHHFTSSTINLNDAINSLAFMQVCWANPCELRHHQAMFTSWVHKELVTQELAPYCRHTSVSVLYSLSSDTPTWQGRVADRRLWNGAFRHLAPRIGGKYGVLTSLVTPNPKKSVLDNNIFHILFLSQFAIIKALLK